jgi:hypothetical protein
VDEVVQKIDGAEPWSGMDVAVSRETRVLFNASVAISVGMGTSIRF